MNVFSLSVTITAKSGRAGIGDVGWGEESGVGERRINRTVCKDNMRSVAGRYPSERFL